MSALKPATGTPFGQQPGEARLPNKAEREQAALKASYLVGNTTPSKVDMSKQDMSGPMLLEVSSIDGYDQNPRLFQNEKYEDIETSIRANGFHDALVVTRRREGERYMLAAGSNTTLTIIKSLWETTGDEKFRWVNCIFQPFEGNTKLLAQHLGENLNRGDMKFWEIARGMVELLRMIAAERGDQKPLSVRDQAEELHKRGLRAEKSAVSRWLFAVERLGALGGLTSALTRLSVGDVIQPRLHALRSLALKFRLTEDAYWDDLVVPVLSAYGREVETGPAESFDAQAMCDRVEAAFSERFNEPIVTIRQMLSVLRLSPELTLADLRTPSPSLISGPLPHTQGAEGTPPADPLAEAQQAPLPLGPGVVRNAATAAAVSAGGTSSKAPRPSGGAIGQSPQNPQTSPQRPQTAPTAAGPLFANLDPAADPLQALYEAVTQLLDAAKLGDTLRWRDEMPIGFFLELPDPAIHARKKVSLTSPEYHARTVKSVVWWSLVMMTGQYREGSVPYMDQKSEFFLRFNHEAETDPLNGTDIENQPPEIDEVLSHRMTPGVMRETMTLMRTVEELATQVFERLPDRWKRMLDIHMDKH